MVLQNKNKSDYMMEVIFFPPAVKKVKTLRIYYQNVQILRNKLCDIDILLEEDLNEVDILFH